MRALVCVEHADRMCVRVCGACASDTCVRVRALQLGPLLDHPQCHIFVCGSSNMAQEVSSAFRFLMGHQRYSELVQASRYHEDVFGMVVSACMIGVSSYVDSTHTGQCWQRHGLIQNPICARHAPCAALSMH